MFDLMAEGKSGHRKHRNALKDLLAKIDGTVRIASAYLTDTSLLSGLKNRDVRLLASLSRMDIISGATSLESLTALIKEGVKCRRVSGAPKLHAKVYIFGDQSAVVTSANLTTSALDRNIEVGVCITGNAARDLILWFDALWAGEDSDLDLATVSRWYEETAAERAEFLALRQRARVALSVPTDRRSLTRPTATSHALFEPENRFFVCNTDRKWFPEGEKLMRDRSYAAAWQKFRYPSHMERVEVGNGIFMFAKRLGIIAVGRVTARCQTFRPGDSDRMRDGKALEWRVPVEWLAWVDDPAALLWKSPRATFFDVSDDKYAEFRRDVRVHFFGNSPDTTKH